MYTFFSNFYTCSVSYNHTSNLHVCLFTVLLQLFR